LTLLDENLPDGQRQQMIKLGIAVRQVGFEWRRKGLSDDNIVAALRREKRLTFLTNDGDFYRREYCHASYCLVQLAVPPDEMAAYARRFLRQPGFRTYALLAGKVVRVQPSGIAYWTRNATRETELPWS